MNDTINYNFENKQDNTFRSDFIEETKNKNYI